MVVGVRKHKHLGLRLCVFVCRRVYVFSMYVCVCVFMCIFRGCSYGNNSVFVCVFLYS